MSSLDRNRVKRLIVSSMQATQNPMAPIILEQVHGRVKSLGQMMAGIPNCDRVKVQQIADTLVAGWTEEVLNEIAITPEFIIALCSSLVTSIEGWINTLPDPDLDAIPDVS